MLLKSVRNVLSPAFMAILLFLSAIQMACAAKQVDINHADIKTIAASLDGIGESKAKAIVDYRTKHGAFRTVEDLISVKGVGSQSIQKNARYIIIK